MSTERVSERIGTGLGNSAHTEVLSSEKARLQAMIDVDLVALDRMLADDCLYVHSSGETDTKASYLSKLADGVLDYRAITASEHQIIDLGSAVVVAHRVEIDVAVGGGAPRHVRGQAAATWRLGPKGPVLAYFQSTALPQTG